MLDIIIEGLAGDGVEVDWSLTLVAVLQRGSLLRSVFHLYVLVLRVVVGEIERTESTSSHSSSEKHPEHCVVSRGVLEVAEVFEYFQGTFRLYALVRYVFIFVQFWDSYLFVKSGGYCLEVFTPFDEHSEGGHLGVESHVVEATVFFSPVAEVL